MKKNVVIWVCVTLLAILNFPYSVAVYNHIGEDAFITFRYAENLVEGKGFVYNPGERIEGYSNFLWLILLAFFYWLGCNIIVVSRILGAAANSALMFVVTLALLSLIRTWRGEKNKLHPLLLVFPAILVFFNPMLHYHADRGLETCFYLLLLALSGFFVIERNFIAAGVGFAAVAFTRPEGFLYAGLAGIFIMWLLVLDVRSTHKPFDLRAFLKFSVPFIVIFASFLIWRRLYFGYWLPNTVYAKVSKLNFYYSPSTGLLWQFLKSWSFLPLVATAGALLIVLNEKNFLLRWKMLFLLSMAFFVLLYTIGIGYILAAPFRHYVPSIPYFIVLLGFCLLYVREKIKPETRNVTIPVLVLIIWGMNFYTYNNLDMPRSRLHVRTFDFLRQWEFDERWQWYREPPIWLAAEAGRWVHENLPHNALLAADQMGQFGYYSRHHIIDTLGLMDTEIAHKGYSTELLLRRNPDYVVWFGMNGEPVLPQFQQTTEAPAFKAHYKLAYILRARNEIDRSEYLVYARRDLLNEEQLTAPPEYILLGLDKESFIQRWRI